MFPTIHIRKASAHRVQTCVPPKGFPCNLVVSSDGEAKLALSDARRRRARQSAVDPPWTQDGSSTLSRCRFSSCGWEPWCISCSYTCSLLESRGSGTVHVLALKLGNTTLIKLGASQWPDCVCSSGRVMTYGDSFPEGTRLIAGHCVVLCANQRQAMVLEGCAHQNCIQQGFARANFTCDLKTRETYAEKERDRIVQALLDTSRCNPAQLEQQFQRDKAKGKGKGAEVNRDPALCVSPDPLPQGRLRGTHRAKKRCCKHVCHPLALLLVSCQHIQRLFRAT